jgi:hypothetical protein
MNNTMNINVGSNFENIVGEIMSLIYRKRSCDVSDYTFQLSNHITLSLTKKNKTTNIERTVQFSRDVIMAYR